MDFLREIGLIYIVVATIVILFCGLAIYLFYLDRKLTSLEKTINNE